tara:strand:+ start:1549 stop:1671 length:123 start_codon:yes stop_codon:yes gene_type:complete
MSYGSVAIIGAPYGMISFMGGDTLKIISLSNPTEASFSIY